jgi:hypothetical protein
MKKFLVELLLNLFGFLFFVLIMALICCIGAAFCGLFSLHPIVAIILASISVALLITTIDSGTRNV